MPARRLTKTRGDERYLQRGELGAPGGVCELDGDGKIPAGVVPTSAPADHGGLQGLGDDDHPQYLTQARGDSRYDPAGSVAAHAALPGHAGSVLTPAAGGVLDIDRGDLVWDIDRAEQVVAA